MVLKLRLLTLVAFSPFLIILLISLPARAQGLAYDAWIEATDNGQHLVLASYCTAPSGSSLEYLLTAEKLSSTGQTKTTQRRRVVVQDIKPVLLSTLYFEKNKTTNYHVELKLFSDGQFVTGCQYP